MRTHRYPDEDFSFYLVGTGLDPQLSAELGCEIELRPVAELAIAATSRQRDRWRIFQFCLHLALNSKSNYPEGAPALGFRDRALDWVVPRVGYPNNLEVKPKAWTTFRQIFQSLYNHKSRRWNIFSRRYSTYRLKGVVRVAAHRSAKSMWANTLKRKVGLIW